jgi:hypothetical protein
VIEGVFILILVFGILTGFLFEYAEGSIEIKKYKVINSPKVCGDKMCSEIDEKRSKKGLSTHNVEICGDRLCNEIQNTPENFTNEQSPYGQYRLGITADLIECRQEQDVVIKKTTHFPACVNTKSVEKLREKGWAISENEQEEIFKEISNNIVKNGDLASQKSSNVSLIVVSEEIYNQRYLMFEGDGWHRLHNVEITFTGESFEESVRTKTDDRGHLNMPWPIPDVVGGKVYKVFATDGIQEFEMSIPISSKNN